MGRSLKPDLPFRRIAVVVSGGGALGAYELGVLKTLEAVALRPSIVAGASAGALNAVAWVAAGFSTGPLEIIWRSLEAGSIGMRWSALAWRAAGAFLLGLGVFEALVIWIGSGELGVTALIWRDAAGRTGVPSAILDSVAWIAVAGAGVLILRSSREAELWLAKLSGFGAGRRVRSATAALLGGWVLLHLLAWALGLPWPHRFSATLLVAVATVWVAYRPGPAGDRLRRALASLLPELKGRGLWRNDARRRLLDLLVRAGDPSRLAGGATHLILTALSLDNGLVAHFVNWTDATGEFRRRVEGVLGEVVLLDGAGEVLQAAIASSAIPMLFEPAAVRGREYVDAVALSTHPLLAATFAGADAALVIVVAPSGAPPQGVAPRSALDVWARYLDLANWRDLRREMAELPASWSAETAPRPLCVVEPADPLPGGVLAYSPRNAAALIERGERDAWSALERAGWLSG